MRYNISAPKISDYEAPKDTLFASHEPTPFFTPDGTKELKKPVDHAENKRAFRYLHCVADPLFRHKQYFRQSDTKPYGPRMSFEDSDKWIHFDTSGCTITNEKGWRMGRGNVVAREGRLYYEVKVVRGVPAGDGPPVPLGQGNYPQPHIRMGWARREAPLDAPVGFDGYSYGVTDIRFETMHRSRSGKLYNPIPKTKSKAKPTKPSYTKEPEIAYVPAGQHVREGDVLGLEITLPSLSLHRKVVDGSYNPAVDVDDGFTSSSSTAPGDEIGDIIRDRIPVPYKNDMYFEHFEYEPTKPIDSYSDRGPFNKIHPHAHHEDIPLRSLPGSSIKVYKNGELVGTAFENLLSFLPMASVPAAKTSRVGFDDGFLGYYPAVSAFCGGIAEVNFGPDFWHPPPSLTSTAALSSADGEKVKERHLRGIGERYREQIAEDVVWDIIDETDFFIQDGAYDYKPEDAPSGTDIVADRAMGGLGEE